MFQDAVRSRPLVLLLSGFFVLYLWANWRDAAGEGRGGAGAGRGRTDVIADGGVYFNAADDHAQAQPHAHDPADESASRPATQPVKPKPQANGKAAGQSSKLRKRQPSKAVPLDADASDPSDAAAEGPATALKPKRRPPPPPPPAPVKEKATDKAADKDKATVKAVEKATDKAAAAGGSESAVTAVTAPPATPAPAPAPAPPRKPLRDKSQLPKLGPFDPSCPTTLVREEDMPPEQPLPPGYVDTHANDPANVVMGLANTYPWNYIRRFVCSLRASGYIGKIVMLGAQWGADTLAHFAAADVIGETYDGSKAHSDLLTYRFELFRQMALKYDTGSNLFLVTDVRDSYFQRNPFEHAERWMKGYPLHLFEESGYLTHRNETINRDWMGRCFGTAEDMYDKRIINGGALFGTAKGIADGCKLVFESATSGRACDGRDQVYLNKLYHTGRMPYALAHPQGDPGAPMNVIGYIPRTDGAPFAHPKVVGDLHPGLLVDEEGFVLDHDRRTRSACLHQYDRFIVIDQLIMRRQPHMYTKAACTWRGGKKIADGIIDW